MPEQPTPVRVRKFGSGLGTQIGQPPAPAVPEPASPSVAPVEVPPAVLPDPGVGAVQLHEHVQAPDSLGAGLAEGVETPREPMSLPPQAPQRQEGTSTREKAPAKGPRLNAAALGRTLTFLEAKDGQSSSPKMHPIPAQLDAVTYMVVSDRAGYRGVPELLRQVLTEVCDAQEITPTHIRNAAMEVVKARRSKEKGGQGPAPKLTVPVDTATNRTLTVLAQRAKLAPKGVMEAIAYIYAITPAANAATVEPAE